MFDTRSFTTRIFSKTRRPVLTVLLSLLAVVLGGICFLGLTSSDRASAGQGGVEAVKSPAIAMAPEAAEVEAADEAGEAAKELAGDEKADAKSQPNANADANANAGAKAAEERDAEEDEPKKPAIPTPPTNDMWMSVPKMGLYNDYVANTSSHDALDRGAIKLPSTGFPWQESANPYIAGHVLGWQGTGSWLQFANLPYVDKGDKVYLGDANGTTYTYEVTEIFTVAPHENWVTDPIPGRDMVTLQTCLNPPAYDVRLIVRADRVDVQPAR